MDNTTVTDNTTDQIVSRFLTVGGATVEVRRHRFQTVYTWQGRPYVTSVEDPQRRTVDGYRWSCLGCGVLGEAALMDGDYLPDEAGKARDDANRHAGNCRAMPLPE